MSWMRNLDEKIIVKTKHGELTLEQLAEVQPGLARLMKEIGDRFHVLYHAAKGGNWKLGRTRTEGDDQHPQSRSNAETKIPPRHHQLHTVKSPSTR